ncbi:MAG: hypothetical protein ABIU54_02660 [Candidatus Eisenbacteria bacterium]
MPRAFLHWLWCLLGPSCALLLLAPATARGAWVADSTWVDHDAQAIQRPKDWQPSYWGQQIRQGLIDPVSHIFDIPDKLLWLARGFGAHTQREAVNVNAFDEAPNSSWFTNRNHTRTVPVAMLRQGPDSVFLPAKPWTLKHAKKGGWSAGFQIKDANGKKWIVKLDTRGHAQLSSGADMVSRTLLHAAGYNVPHNEPVRFQRGDITIDPELLTGEKGEHFTPADLESVLVRGAVHHDGSYSASASMFIEGHVLGSPSMSRLRPGDSNDWYSHANRRELRGLFVLCSWINDWDTKDHQFLDTFVETRDSLGHVKHYFLDVGSSFGAAADGPKHIWAGYENMVDYAWIGRRFVTLGFVQEPWRRAHQATGIPSIGNYESEVYRPEDFRQMVPHPAFREMTDRDGYWGAKIVASFSDAQIAAAVEAAHYDDPRATEYLVRNLIVRRDKIARHWFSRVAPLDFFSVQDRALQFHDLAVDIGLESSRSYHVEVVSVDGGRAKGKQLEVDRAELPLEELGSKASRMGLRIRVAGSSVKPTHVELTRKGAAWTVTRVRHG